MTDRASSTFYTRGPAAPAAPLTLLQLAGPPIDPVTIRPGKPTLIGRSAQADLILADTDAVVSRRHAIATSAGERWLLTDQDSRHGTYVNGVRATPNQAIPLAHGDIVQIGPWAFRVRIGQESGTHVSTVVENVTEGGQRQSVESVSGGEFQAVNETQLRQFLDAAVAIGTAADEKALGERALEALLPITGFPRGALVRFSGGPEVEVIAVGGTGGSAGGFVFSRSLLAGASQGRLVRLDTESAMQAGMSIANLGILSALCAPVFFERTIAAYLYLDARRGEHGVRPGAVAYCRAMATMCGLALANLKRAELEKRQKTLESDLQSARQVQQLLMPADDGEVNGVPYAVRTRPGRIVAGDLFDVMPLAGGQVGVVIGDVMGKGAGAGMLMACAQTLLRSALMQSPDPARAVTQVNEHLTARGGDMWVSLWVGVIDPVARTLRYVDAGHGHWVLRGADGTIRESAGPTGMPAGIEASASYGAPVVELTPGSRIVLYSDGLVEQQGPDGEQFGLDRVVLSLHTGAGVGEEAGGLLEALDTYAAGAPIADDVTVAALEVR